MNPSRALLLRALEHVLQAEELVADVPGCRDAAFRDANLRDLHAELQHLGRRLRNTCLVHGCPPDAVHAVTRREQ